MSDDEDMEADVVALEREEFVRYVACFVSNTLLLISNNVTCSTRIARKEDLEAEEEERRHEEEKRRRRKERDRASD